MIAQKRDKNESLIVSAFERCGAYVSKMDKSAGFDLLVVTPRGVHVVEDKDPSQRWKLTENEAAVKRAIELAGGAYYVIETPEETAGLAMGDSAVILELLEKEIPGDVCPMCEGERTVTQKLGRQSYVMPCPKCR